MQRGPQAAVVCNTQPMGSSLHGVGRPAFNVAKARSKRAVQPQGAPTSIEILLSVWWWICCRRLIVRQGGFATAAMAGVGVLAYCVMQEYKHARCSVTFRGFALSPPGISSVLQSLSKLSWSLRLPGLARKTEYASRSSAPDVGTPVRPRLRCERSQLVWRWIYSQCH